MITDRFLPQAAISNLIVMMSAFKNTLSSSITYFNMSQDEQSLKLVVNSLRQDLKLFKKSFDYWYQNANTDDEIDILEDLAKELGEAQALLAQASSLVKHKAI